jgi:ribonuclease VapC
VIIDTSALLAIVLGESDRVAYVDALTEAPSRRMSAANWLEATLVLEGCANAIALDRFEAFVAEAKIELVPVSIEQAGLARHAFRLYGRGRHRACLNFGDCFAYALAKETAFPLLFKGSDFTHTDIEPALKD